MQELIFDTNYDLQINDIIQIPEFKVVSTEGSKVYVTNGTFNDKIHIDELKPFLPQMRFKFLRPSEEDLVKMEIAEAKKLKAYLSLKKDKVSAHLSELNEKLNNLKGQTNGD